MTAPHLINSLAERGFVLLRAGTKLRISPASLLSDEDREQIRRFKDEMLPLLPPARIKDNRAEQRGESARSSPVQRSQPHSYGLAHWPIPDRQRWGELANKFQDDGFSTEVAVQRAYEIVLAERDITGHIFLFIEEHPTPVPFPQWSDLIDPRDYLPQSPQRKRPSGHPTYGITKNLHVVELATWTKSRHATDPVTKVTAEGWDDWYPFEEGDLSSLSKDTEPEDHQGQFAWENDLE
jgi:hypothetical protein